MHKPAAHSARASRAPSDPLQQFIDGCQHHNSVAEHLFFPLFTTGLRQETPLNSAPYIYRIDEIGAQFGTSPHRKKLVRDLRDRIDMLAAAGLRHELMLIGGSFLRFDREPADIDALVVYSRRPGADPVRVEQTLKDFAAPKPAGGTVDLRLCPSDCHPLVMVKRVIFFSNLFSYDRGTDRLDRGIIMVLPRIKRPDFTAKKGMLPA